MVSGGLHGISTATPKSGAIAAGIALSAWRGLSGSVARLANFQDNTQYSDVERRSLGLEVPGSSGRASIFPTLGTEFGGRERCGYTVP